jgi:hypothetical protein
MAAREVDYREAPESEPQPVLAEVAGIVGTAMLQQIGHLAEQRSVDGLRRITMKPTYDPTHDSCAFEVLP